MPQAAAPSFAGAPSARPAWVLFVVWAAWVLFLAYLGRHEWGVSREQPEPAAPRLVISH